MKRKFLAISAILWLSAQSLFAQAPEQFSYQSVIRDAQGQLITNQSVSIQVTILQGGASGIPVLVERHFPTSNTNGLVTLNVGNGIVMAGSFSSIDWSAGPYYAKIEMDPTGGTNYSISSTSQFLSVPYALYAQNSGNGQGPQGPAGTNGADGTDGVGIVSTVNNGNGTYTFNYSDGSSFTTADLTGPQGATGATGAQGPAGATGAQGPQGIQGPAGTNGTDGVGIVSTVNNGNGTYTFNYSDGSSFTTADLTGPQGATGATGAQGPAGATGAQGPQGIQGPAGTNGTDGVGIVSTVNNGNGTYTFNYSDGSSFTTADLTGPQGATGATGAQGPAGATGAQGPQGIQGPAGTNGTDGVGIVSTVNNGNGTYTFNYSDGSNFTTADLTGPQGATGAQGPAGATGPQGPAGATGATGSNGLSALVKTTSEAAGANCEYGGVKIQGGVDLNNDGILQTSEVTTTEYVCDGNPNGFDHYIGEVYGGGIIYYLWRDAGGTEHGLIVSPSSLTNYPWASTNTYISNCASTFNGLSNTNSMVAAGNTTSEAGGAADAYAAGGYTDWYLPSVDEMALMVDQRFIINKVIVGGAMAGAGTIAGSYFWTSNQLSTTNALVYDSISQSVTNFTKSTLCLLRPIRAF